MTSDPEDRDDEGLPDSQLTIDDLTTTEPDHGMVAVYVRDGDPPKTIRQLLTHARNELGHELTDDRIETVAGVPENTDNGGGVPPGNDEAGAVALYDNDEKHPAGVEALIDAVTEHDVNDVVVTSLTAFGGVDEATRVIERLQDEDVTTHLVKDDLTVEADDERAHALLTAARRASRTDVDASQLVTEAAGTSTEWTGGQPPRGFTVSATGHLERGEDWEMIRRAARAVEQDELTEYRASKVTGISRHALRTALGEYRDIYRVEEADPLRVDADEQ